jgi:serine/threonine protein kinase
MPPTPATPVQDSGDPGTASPGDDRAEVLLAEQARRWQAGDRCRVEALLGESGRPNLDDRALLDLIYHEAILREYDGDLPVAEEYVRRFPRLAAELRLQFELDRLVRPHSVPVETSVGDGDTGRTGTSPDSMNGDPRFPSIPGYQIVSALGRGGMGIAFKAWQTSLKRTVALKLLHAHDDPENQRRFRAEAEAAARLQHSNIVQVFEVNQHRGRPFLAMEYVAGGTLAQKLRGEPQTALDAVRTVETLAEAIHYAHEHGVIHRDLKPANILLTTDFPRPMDESRGELEDTLTFPPGSPSSAGNRAPTAGLKIADFGLAKQVDADTAQTQTGAILGTPSYMAPEQARGAGKEVGPATDVYALGAILYEMLTGRPPFRAGTVLETLDLVRSEEPVPPRRLVPKTPRDLETICLKCLEKDPAKRYPSASVLAEDLRRFRQGEPIAARPVGRPERAWKWAKRRPALAASGLVSGLALVALLVASQLHNVELQGTLRQLRDQKAETDKENQKARANLRAALAAVDEMLVRVARVPLAKTPHTEVLRAELFEEALKFQQGFLNDYRGDPGLQWDIGRTLRRLGTVYRFMGRDREAEKVLREAIVIEVGLVAELPGSADRRSELGLSYDTLGKLLTDGGRTREAEETFRRALACRTELTEAHPDELLFWSDLADTYGELGVLLKRTGRVKDGGDLIAKSVPLRERAAAARPDDVDARNKLANAYLDTDRVAKAIAIWEKLIETPAPAAGHRASLAFAYTRLANDHRQHGRPGEAEAYIHKSIELLEGLAAEYPLLVNYRKSLSWTYNQFGLLLIRTDRAAEGENAFNRALELNERLVADFPNRPELQTQLADNYGNWGNRLKDTGRRAEADGMYRRMLALRERLVREHPHVVAYRYDLARTHTSLAISYRGQKKLKEADEEFRQCIPLLDKLAANYPANPDYRESLNIAVGSHGQVLVQLGHGKEAADCFRRAIALGEALVSEKPSSPIYRSSLAMDYHRLTSLPASEQPEETEKHLERAMALQEPLAAEFPKSLTHQERLAIILGSLARLLRDRGKFAAAAQLFERGIGRAQAALSIDPRNLEARRSLSDQYAGLAETHLRQSDHRAAAANAEKLARVFPEDGDHAWNAAGFLARCMPLAGADAALAPDRRRELADDYGKQAVVLLRRAVRQRPANFLRLKDSKDLEPLRTRPDCAELMEEHEAKDADGP